MGNHVFDLIKRHFLAGILVLIPFAVIAWILGAVVGGIWQLHLLLPEAWRPEAFFEEAWVANVANLVLTLAIVLLLVVAVSFLGWSSKQYLGRKSLELLGDVIARIPVIRSIYSALDQLLTAVASGGGRQFSRVVYVEYPRRDCWTLAFVTGPARVPGIPPNHVNLYVPTTPNPTSGFHLIVPEADVRESNLKVEDAFKTILSLGIAQGESRPGRAPKPAPAERS